MLRYIALVAVLIAPAWSYSSGAPPKICFNDLVPEHHVLPQTSSALYTLSGGDSVKSGELLDLTLSGDEFLGFAIQARTANKKPIGSFKADGEFSQTLNCSAIDNTLTHKKLAAPIKSLSIKWQAPQSYQGPVTFYSTVAKNATIFWVGQVKKDVNVI